ncbi:tight adherence pilus pseudopilin TadF [Vibrio hannami]|uniref:tight adherence pilus pseudopilin TadF n=1 Tax=Vibrio hannami TaxID=2717094 RepID=UPI0024108F5D|nr:tight adherence pilus pseudopilin TadF [Vibrio hannami]MDG3085985.1 tight adherence pilus pseudopilin TadF [Vibrio hannami]
MRKLSKKQKGAFVVEFAILSLFLGTLFLFSIDVAIKLSVKGKLDRLSYSIVSLVKERTQLYGGDFNITQAQADQLLIIANNSLARTFNEFDEDGNGVEERFGMVIEELVDSGTGQEYAVFNLGNRIEGTVTGCVLDQTLQDLEQDDALRLSVETTWNRTSPMYRVTLCWDTEDLVSTVLDNGFSTVVSSSSVSGR